MIAEWYSPQDLAGLPGMPRTERGTLKWLQKNLAVSRTKRRGKGCEYHFDSLPAETRQYLAEQTQQKVLASMPADLLPAVRPQTLPAVAARSAQALDALLMEATDKQVATFTARKVVLRELENLAQSARCSIRNACTVLLINARAGMLPPNKLAALMTARDPRGKPSADGLPSLRRLQAWVEQKETTGHAALLPRASAEPDFTAKPWHAVVMTLWGRPQKPTIRSVHEQLLAQWLPEWGYPPGAPAPSYDAVVRFLNKTSVDDKLAGRHLGSALRAKRFYQHRTAHGLKPFDEVHADGWNTHFTAPHPVTGEYVTYELWHYQCVATKYLTPMSIGLSESAEVILQGLQNCIRIGGVPSILQTDSTGSVKNDKVEYDPVSSISARMGLTVVHPVTVGNSQANGIAENLNTWLDRESRALATYQHPERMDTLAYKRVRKFTTALTRAGKKGDVIADSQARAAALKAGKGILFETHDQAVQWIRSIEDKWNNHPHRSLPKIRDAAGKLVHMTPAQSLQAAREAGWEPVALSERELADAFHLHVIKKVTRGTVSPYAGQRYHHSDLRHYEGEEVMVAVDPHEWRNVLVKDLDGRVLAMAEFVQATGYRAQTVYEAAQEKRAAAQIKRKEQQIDAIVERMAPPALESSAVEVFEIPARDIRPLDVLDAMPGRRETLPAQNEETAEPDDPFQAYLRKRHLEKMAEDAARAEAEAAEATAAYARAFKEVADAEGEPYIQPAPEWKGGY
jgi:putative transposase